MPQSDGLVPPAGGAPRALQTRKALVMSKCRCGLPVRMEDPSAWDWANARDGRRGAVLVPIPCECGIVNTRTTGDVLRFGRTIGAFQVPAMMQGLTDYREALVDRLEEHRRAQGPQPAPDPDKAPPPPPRPMDDETMARNARTYAYVSKFQAQLAGVFVEKSEVTVEHTDATGGETLRRLAEEVAREIAEGQFKVADAEVVKP